MNNKRTSTSFDFENKAAEKWTEEKVIEKLNEILKFVVENNTVFIGTALIKNDLYKEIWAYFYTKFNDNQAVFKLLKKVEQIIESNLVEAGLDNLKNTPMAIFTLKNHHGWVDKTETEMTMKPEKPKITFDDSIE